MNRILRLTRPDVFSSGESLLERKVLRLTRAIHDPRNLSADYVRCIRALEATRHEGAPLIVGEFLDMPGPVGDEAVRAMVSLATCGVGRCRFSVVDDCFVRIYGSLDDDEIRNAHRVLAALEGLEGGKGGSSQRALAADCWADAEEQEERLYLAPELWKERAS